MKTLGLAAIAVLLAVASSLGSSSDPGSEVDPPSPLVAEPQQGEQTVGRRWAWLDRKHHPADRAAIVTSDHRAGTPVVGLNRGPDYKLRVIEPRRDLDYKLVWIRPDPNVDYKLRILGAGGHDVYPCPLTNGRKTMIIDPHRGERRN